LDNLSIALQTSWFLITATILLGLIVGSFLNVVIFRLPKIMEQAWQRDCCELLEQTAPDTPPISLSSPNSQCRNCGIAIKPWHNIPVLSYVFLRGCCAGCGAPISRRYPIIELCTALLSLAAAIAFGPTLQLAAALLLIWSLIALTGIDIDTQLLPDSITLPLLWLGLLLNINSTFTSLNDAVIGAAAGYLTLWGVYWIFKLTTGKDGMGFGDFKLLAALGAWFGWQAIPLIIILSSFVGAFIGLLLILLKKQGREVPMPFGPYLAGAGLLTLFYGDQLTATYFSLIGF
jgi:leader peptidase (prepilin peptidase)/N-methyltransferase